MENKYFTPSIEDIHVGFECELQDEKHWNSFKFYRKYDFEIDLERRIHTQTIRVPYLTKEQIEAEGWKEGDTPGFFDKIIDPKDRWFIDWEKEKQLITIGDNENEVNYTGPCKDINTFRKIIKLLNIK